MSVRKTVTFTTLDKLLPAACNTAEILFKVFFVCVSTSVGKLPSPSIPIEPLQNTKPFALIAGEYGPITVC